MKDKTSWIEENLEEFECNLCQMSDKKFLNYGGKPLIFHTIDRTILHLQDALITKSKWGVFIYPIENTDIIVAMCIDAIYTLYDIQNKSDSDKDKVLLISNTVSPREMYWNLKTNDVRINEIFPMGIIKIDGSVKKQLKTEYFNKRATNQECNFLHTSNYRLLPDESTSKKIGCVVIDTKDLDRIAIQKITEWAKKYNINSVIYLENNPYSESLNFFLSENFPIWGWTFENLKEDFKDNLKELETKPETFENPFALSVFHIANVLKGIKHTFIEIKEEGLDEALNESLKLYFDIKNLSKNKEKEVLSKALRIYLMTKSAFEGMLAPLDYTENQSKQSFLAKTLQKRIQILESWQNFLSKYDPAFGGIWAKTYSIARVLYNKFKENGNPKYKEIKRLVREAIDYNKKILILNYSEPYSRALIDALNKDLNTTEEELNNKGIFITSSINKNISENYDQCIVFGAPHWWANWVLRLSCAKEIIFLVYSSEKALLNYQFELEKKKFKEYFEIANRINFLKKVLDKDELKNMPAVKKYTEETENLIELTESESKDEEKFKSLFEDINTEEELAYETDDEEPDETEYLAISNEGKIVVKCCKITFERGGCMYFKYSRRLPIFKDGKKIAYLKINNVKQEDSVVIVKNSIRTNLAQEIIKKADKHPKMQKLKFLVNSWRIILNKGMVENRDTSKKFLVKLNKLQDLEEITKIRNDLTIFLWKEGFTIGPQNSKNIKLIGKIYNEPFLIENYKEISTAISRLRGIHQTLLRKFNEVALRAGVKTMNYGGDEMLDEEFDLHLEDFAGLVTIEKIKSIDLNATTERAKLDKLLE